MILIASLLCLSLMTGSEICVALFINPVLRRMPEVEQAPFERDTARYLGQVMPFWYAVSFLLTAAAAWSQHVATGAWDGATWSAGLQATVILMTLTLLVPINNRLGKLGNGATGWLADARRWDRLHQLRVVLLLVAVTLQVQALQVPRAVHVTP